jgi:glycosyltransferase involved in cell wall biosynthesis
VIPAFNARRWIAETLDSVYQQTYPHAQMEIIVVDDGSLDDTADVARSAVQGRTIRGRVIQFGRNQGVSAARNAGLAAASGEWIQFLDADDLLASNKVALQMEATSAPDADGVGVVYSNWQEIHEIDGEWRPVPPVHDLFVDDEPIIRILQDQYFGYVGPALIRKSALETIAGFNEHCNLAEDLDCMLRLAMAGERFAKAGGEQAAFFYRQTPTSLWKDGVRSVESMRAFLDVYRRTEAFLRSQNAAGAICEGGRVGLSRRYTKWAAFYLEHDAESFRDIARRVARLGVDPAPALNRNMRFLTRCVGWENALRLRSSFRRAAASVGYRGSYQPLLCE